MIYRSLAEIGPDFGPSVITIGNFDGAHSGHRQIFRRVVALARELNARPTVLTFHPHPARIVAPERTLKLLNSPGERAEVMLREGIEQVLIVPFDRAFSHQTPDEFVHRVLVEKLKVRAVLVGDNFRFGSGHAGSAETLVELGRKYGFRTEIVKGVRLRGRLVSSTAVRRLIEAGNVSLAGRFLERPYALEGMVVPGHGVGSRKTVPTLNLATRAEVLPARGVYITRTTDPANGRRWPSLTNLGVRPTFGGDTLAIETFLLAPLEDGDPRAIRVEFLRRVRDERKFESPEALKAQILKDAQRARAYFRRLERWAKPEPAQPGVIK